MTLPEHLHRQAAAQSERTAMIYVTGNTVQRISYREFYDQVQRVAGWLQQRGIQKGDRGLIILENRPEWPVSYFGLLLAAAPRCPWTSNPARSISTTFWSRLKPKSSLPRPKRRWPRLGKRLRSNTWWWRGNL